MHRRRDRLKAATRTMHEQVEAMIETAGLLHDLGGYARFLAAMHRFHACAEQATTAAAREGLVRDWRRPASARLLGADLAALGKQPADPQPVPCLTDQGAVLGLHYVAQGSALGATQLLPRALALGVRAAHGGAFLTHHAASTREWPQFLSQLEDAPLSANELESMEHSAVRAFQLVGDCLRSQCCAMEV